MAEFLKITCDGCGSDVTYTTNAYAWRLHLRAELMPVDPDARCVTDVALGKPIERVHHFCYMGCLDLWRGRMVKQAEAWNRLFAEWKRDHPEGEPPADVVAIMRADAAAEGLRFFPLRRAS